MSQRCWLATAVIFRPSDMSLGFAETWTVIAPVTAETLEGGSRALVHRWRKPVDQWLSETAAPIGHSRSLSDFYQHSNADACCWYRNSLHPSIRLSVTLWDCIETAMCTIKPRHFPWLWVTTEGYFGTVVILFAQLMRDVLAIAEFLVENV